MPPRSEDPYVVLGVAPDADAVRIRGAYLALMRAHHPDRRGGGTAATAAASRINAAYAELRDPARRAVLDRLRASRSGGASGGGSRLGPGSGSPSPAGAATPHAAPAYSVERVDYGRRFQRASLRVGLALLAVGLVLLLALAR